MIRECFDIIVEVVHNLAFIKPLESNYETCISTEMSEITCKIMDLCVIVPAELVVTSWTPKLIIGVLHCLKQYLELHTSCVAHYSFTKVAHDQIPAIHAGIAPLFKSE